MRKRFISLMLALLYFSVSIAFCSPHAHDHGKSLPDQCVACAWHLEANADVPTEPFHISAPRLALVRDGELKVQPTLSMAWSLKDRGPPAVS